MKIISKKVTLQELQNIGSKKAYPRFKAGHTVRVHEKIQEGKKSRIQIFEGLVIQSKGKGNGQTITVRKIIKSVGVEKIFSIFSESIEKIEIVKEAKVRRSKLFFMRNRRGKSARLREKFLTESDLEKMKAAKPEKNEITEENKSEIEDSKQVKTQDSALEKTVSKKTEIQDNTSEKAEKQDSVLEKKDSKTEKVETKNPTSSLKEENVQKQDFAKKE